MATLATPNNIDNDLPQNPKMEYVFMVYKQKRNGSAIDVVGVFKTMEQAEIIQKEVHRNMSVLFENEPVEAVIISQIPVNCPIPDQSEYVMKVLLAKEEMEMEMNLHKQVLHKHAQNVQKKKLPFEKKNNATNLLLSSKG